ncbi:MAG: VCBS repeat-containing protein [Flavobacteriales bacterium]|nr:VCBS repeat-containing protein [Flavobacteriales bacterium]
MMRPFFFLVGITVLFVSCGTLPNKKTKGPMFEALSPQQSGIFFSNVLDDTRSIPSGADSLMENLPWGINELMYNYAGGGVSVADINNNGLPDIFFTSNQGEGALYLNLGDFRFQDITKESGLTYPAAWVTGTVMADVNGDGFMDIYVCRAGKKPMSNTSNLLFINNGNLTFTERAAEYGLNDIGLTTSASFFDMDLDGDLDVYVLNQPIFGEEDPTSFQFEILLPHDSLSADRLYENVGNRFVDVTFQAGLPVEKGSGLGITISDLDMDGLPDIFVANDWITNDFVYINQGNGKFENQCEELLPRNSFFSMGCDIADVDNNGRPDVFVCDMAPYSHYRRNMILNGAPQEYYQLQKRYKGVMQYSRNMLHLNYQGGFQETGNMHGIARTDWSWSPLLVDLDNDGLKDLFVTNGMKRDVGNMDFEMLMYADLEGESYKRERAELVKNYPVYRLPNRAFRNNSAGRWIDVTDSWGFGGPLNTQGSAYADLDLDGNIDLILNPTDSVARIYKNHGDENNHLSIKILGAGKNTLGLGTKVWLFNNGETHFCELSNARGFQSSSEPIIHFGVGKATLIDSIRVVFPLGSYQVLKNVPVQQRITLTENGSNPQHLIPLEDANDTWSNATHRIIPAFKHNQPDFFDFARDKTAFRMFSREGPALVVADVNGDLRQDFFVGGQAGQPSRIYIQTTSGEFLLSNQPEIEADSTSADVDAVIVDLNADGYPDLYVASGSNLFPISDERYLDRLYLNNGKGQFKRCKDCLEDIRVSSGCVAAHDVDDDGIPELFVGGRVVPGTEGIIPESYLLQNSNGRFSSTSNTIIKNLPSVGMVTDAIWHDLNTDGEKELIVTCEWESPKVYKWSKNVFTESAAEFGINLPNGLWTSISVCDANADGKQDLLFGNWGLNSILTADVKKPLKLLINDFDGNGKQEPLLCIYLNDTLDSFLGRNEICGAMPQFWRKYNTYQSFATTPLTNKFGLATIDNSEYRTVNELQSTLMMNSESGKYTQKSLPFGCQAASINAAITLNGDKRPILFGGNESLHYTEGAIDALGVRLLSLSESNILQIQSPKLGELFPLFRNVSSAEIISINGEEFILVARPSNELLLVKP